MADYTELKRARIRSGLMQVELARRAGVSPSMLSRYEKGWAVPTKPTASKLSKALGIPVSELFADVRIDNTGNPELRYENPDRLDVVQEYLEETLGKPADASAREKGGSHVKTVHLDDAVEVMSMDRPGPGGLCHQYEFYAAKEDGVGMAIGSLHFQEGRVKEVGVNGVQTEAIMSIMIDRLRTLYASEKATGREKCALMHLLKAREALTTEAPDE